MTLAAAKPYAVAAYALNEASGDALDAVGANDLAEGGSVGTAAGLLGNCRDFESGVASRFSHADDPAFSVGDVDWTVAFYIKPESINTANGLVSKYAGGSLEYLVRFVSSKVQVIVSTDGSSNAAIFSSDTFGTLSAGNWYSVAVVYDSVGNEVRLYVNAVKDTATSIAGGIYDGTATFYLGDDGGADRYDGLMDEVVILKGYAFTDADATAHHNGGAGVAFADWDAGAAAAVVHRLAPGLVAGSTVWTLSPA